MLCYKHLNFIIIHTTNKIIVNNKKDILILINLNRSLCRDFVNVSVFIKNFNSV